MNALLLALLAVALCVVQWVGANQVFATEYISTECAGESKEVVFSQMNACITISAEMSVMAGCEELREFPNDSCEGAPIQVRRGCVSHPVAEHRYIKLSCKPDAQTSLQGVQGDLCNASNEDGELLDDMLLAPVQDFEASYDDTAVIIPVQTSAAGRVSPPYGVMAFLAVFFVIF